jgi:aspartate carbamoyltransferase catalytic subunit|tara:strand:- start:1265 stop:2245 length:981 start_codon:yes stop_codon:yes gene_type:complete
LQYQCFKAIELVLMAINNNAIKISQKHLLGIQDLSISDVKLILDEAKKFISLNKSKNKKLDILRGKTQINLFFEPSTRTQSSFELAGKRLGADVMSMNITNSAIKKGETLIDTAMTLNAMHPDIIVVRHQDSGASNLLSQKVNCSVLNAGDGRREHPTQALLDALTIIEKKKKIEGLRIAICGDILHSRVARSNIFLLNMLGAEVNIVAPTNLMPKDIEKFGVKTFSNMKEGVKDCDIVMMLRLQNERMSSSFLSSNREYYEYYGLTPDKLEKAKKDAIIMHPGPMNRGIEIDTKLADDINKSVIKEQVELGVAVRMACLKIFCEK